MLHGQSVTSVGSGAAAVREQHTERSVCFMVALMFYVDDCRLQQRLFREFPLMVQSAGGSVSVTRLPPDVPPTLSLLWSEPSTTGSVLNQPGAHYSDFITRLSSCRGFRQSCDPETPRQSLNCDELQTSQSGQSVQVSPPMRDGGASPSPQRVRTQSGERHHIRVDRGPVTSGKNSPPPCS